MKGFLAAVFPLVITFQTASAESFSSEPFLARLALSIDRASNHSESAGRLASAAYPGSSSGNPAAPAFAAEQTPRGSSTPISLSSINAFAESEAQIAVLALTSSFELENGDVLSGEVHTTETISSKNREKLISDLTGREVVLGWSRAIATDLSVGLKGRVATAEIIHEAFSPDLGGQPARYGTEQRGIDLWLGVLGRINDRVKAGAVMRLGWIESETDVKNLTTLGLIPPLTTLSTIDDEAHILGLKAGLSWELTDSSQTYLDLQYIGVDSNYAGSTEVGRAFFGIQQNLTDSLKGIAGVAFDTESELTAGLGLSMRMTNEVNANVSVQYNGAPEIKHEFGRIDYFNASLALIF